MTTPVEAGGGILLALSFALLWQRRVSGMLLLLALQSTVAAVMAAWLADWPLAALEFVWGVVALPWLLSRAPALTPLPALPVATLTGGAALTVVSLPLGVIGPGLAVVLLAGLFMTVRPRSPLLVLGLGSLQTGILAAGLAFGPGSALLAAPCLPALGLAFCPELHPAVRIWRGSFSRFRPELQRADFVACVLMALFACLLPFLAEAAAGPWRLDAPGILAAVLASLAICILRWPALPHRAGLFGCLTVLGGLIAFLAAPPVLAWIGLAIATAATARHRQPGLAGIGLGLALFGSVLLPAALLPACVTLLVGLGCLAALGPELAIVAVLFLLRCRSEIGPGADPLLLGSGLLALFVAAAGLATRPARLPVLATLGQAGVALFAFGLDLPAARLAGVLQLVLLVLTRLALELAPEAGLPRMAALSGLAGLPPLGLFPSLALVIAATTSRAPLLLVPLLAGLAALGWLVLRAMPAERHRLRPSLAWLPLAAALLIGFALPGPLGAGLRLVAGQLP